MEPICCLQALFLGSAFMAYSRESFALSVRIMNNSRKLSGTLDRLTAILSLLQPLDRYRTPSAIESAIGSLSRPISLPRTVVGVLNRLVLNCLGGSTARWWHYYCLIPL